MNGLSLEERKDAVYGTDYGDLYQILPYGCRRRLWYSKRSAPDFPGEDTVVMAMGKALEPLVCEQWQRRHLEFWLRESATISTGMLAGHPDRLVSRDEVIIGVLEVKTCGHWMMREFIGHGLPERYIYQLQHYLWLIALADMGKHTINKGYYSVMDRETGKTLDFQVDLSDNLARNMEKDAVTFMAQVRDDDAGPEKLAVGDKRCKRCQFRTTCQGLGAAVEAIEYDGHKVAVTALDGEDALAQQLAQYAQFTAIASEADDERTRLKPEIVEEMGRRRIEAVSCPGVDGGYRLTRYKQNRIDTKQLTKEMPTIAAKYTKQSEVVSLRSITETEE